MVGAKNFVLFFQNVNPDDATLVLCIDGTSQIEFGSMPLNTPKLASLINFEAVALYFGKEENNNDIEGTEEQVENEENETEDLLLDDIDLEQTEYYDDLEQDENGSEETLYDENDETEFYEGTEDEENEIEPENVENEIE